MEILEKQQRERDRDRDRERPVPKTVCDFTNELKYIKEVFHKIINHDKTNITDLLKTNKVL